MKKVKLERLQSDKFTQTVVGPEVMKKIKAGELSGTSEEYPDGKKVTDTYTYYCCAGKYDCKTVFSDGYTFIRMRDNIWDNTLPCDYDPPTS